MAYKGKFTSFKNPSKYVGDIENVTFRSLWERNVMIWLDQNPNVKEWASEEFYLKYDNPITGKLSKYYPDFYVKMIDGTYRVIEVKPEKELSRPAEPKRKTKNYVNEVSTWLVNQEKWKTAKMFCEKHDMSFEIWTENTLDEIGIQKKNTTVPLAEKKAIASTQKPKHKPVNRTKRPRPVRRS